MRLRFPLYGQILLWFFLNLTLVAGALYLVCTVIFGMDVRTLVRDGVELRLTAAGREIGAALRAAPGEQWESLLSGFEDQYGVEFAVVRPDGRQLMAGSLSLPDELRKVVEREDLKPPPGQRRRVPQGAEDRPGPPGQGRRGPEGEGEGRFPPPSRRGGEGDGPAPEGARPDPPLPKPRMLFFERSQADGAYWAGVRLSLASEEHRHPPNAVLVARATSLRGNEVFVDWRPWVWALLAVLAVSALVWLPFVHGLTGRLRRLTSRAEAISEGDFGVAAASRRSDEIGRLSRAIRQMSLRLETFVTGQKRFLGDTAHELCSPLARIRMSLGLLEREVPEGKRERLHELELEVEELSQLVNELLAFSKASLKPTSLSQEEFSLLDLVEELVRREAGGSVVECSVSPEITCKSNREFFRRALGNLLKNAVRYAGQAGPIEISALVEGPSVAVRLSDQGPGIPQEWIERVLEPFARPESARTREGGGVGLGLAIAKTCAEALGGRLRLRNQRPNGLIATLTVPLELQTIESETT